MWTQILVFHFSRCLLSLCSLRAVAPCCVYVVYIWSVADVCLCCQPIKWDLEKISFVSNHREVKQLSLKFVKLETTSLESITLQCVVLEFWLLETLSPVVFATYFLLYIFLSHCTCLFDPISGFIFISTCQFWGNSQPSLLCSSILTSPIISRQPTDGNDYTIRRTHRSCPLCPQNPSHMVNCLLVTHFLICRRLDLLVHSSIKLTSSMLYT